MQLRVCKLHLLDVAAWDYPVSRIESLAKSYLHSKKPSTDSSTQHKSAPRGRLLVARYQLGCLETNALVTQCLTLGIRIGVARSSGHLQWKSQEHMSLDTFNLLMHRILSAVWHCTCKGQNRSQLKQTSISEQTIWQLRDLDSEEIGAVIKLSLYTQ
jgi:hypothetical protein